MMCHSPCRRTELERRSAEYEGRSAEEMEALWKQGMRVLDR